MATAASGGLYWLEVSLKRSFVYGQAHRRVSLTTKEEEEGEEEEEEG